MFLNSKFSILKGNVFVKVKVKFVGVFILVVIEIGSGDIVKEAVAN